MGCDALWVVEGEVMDDGDVAEPSLRRSQPDASSKTTRAAVNGLFMIMS